MALLRLGIDFGTSTTVAALAGRDGRIRPLVLDGSPLLASAVFASDGPDLLVGGDALRAAPGDPAAFEANPKRRIDDGMVWLAEREWPVVGLVAAVLARVAAEAVRVAGAPMDEVVLTHPATWGRPRLGVLAEAATRAGLAAVRFVPEPVAAAAYFVSVLHERIATGRSIVVYDLGAGTFDVSVVRPSADGFAVLAADGLPDVGGLDLDAAVVAHARAAAVDEPAAWERLDWPKEPADHRARRTLWDNARAVKEQLSRHSSGVLHVPLMDRQLHLTRVEFEAAASSLLERTVELTHRLLRRAGVPPEQVAGVFLVGGSSRIPLAASMLHRGLRIAPTVLDQPELVVAEGALHTPAAASLAQPGASAAIPSPRQPEVPVTEPVGSAAWPVDGAAAGPPAGGGAPASHAVFPSGGGSSGTRWRRSWSVAAAALAVVAVVALVWYVNSANHGPTTSPGSLAGSRPSAGGPGNGSAGEAPANVSATRPAAAATGLTTSVATPTGWRQFIDPSGYSISVPDTMPPSDRAGTHQFFADPSGSPVLLVDHTEHPGPDALADVKDKDRKRGQYVRCAHDFDDGAYHLIAIAPVDYSPRHRSGVTPASNAADWEYTCRTGGATYHVLYRDFVTGPYHGYAILWTTTPVDWANQRSTSTSIFDSFVPADD